MMKKAIVLPNIQKDPDLICTARVVDMLCENQNKIKNMHIIPGIFLIIIYNIIVEVFTKLQFNSAYIFWKYIIRARSAKRREN